MLTAGAPERQGAPFPWDEAIGFGLGILRLAPAALWALSPRELALAARMLRGGSSDQAMDRAALDALLARYPDQGA